MFFKSREILAVRLTAACAVQSVVRSLAAKKFFPWSFVKLGAEPAQEGKKRTGLKSERRCGQASIKTWRLSVSLCWANSRTRRLFREWRVRAAWRIWRQLRRE